MFKIFLIFLPFLPFTRSDILKAADACAPINKGLIEQHYGITFDLPSSYEDEIKNFPKMDREGSLVDELEGLIFKGFFEKAFIRGPILTDEKKEMLNLLT